MIRQSQKRQGFTLIELIVTLVVVGVLASLALPAYNTVLERSRSSEGSQVLIAVLGAQLSYFEDNGVYTTDINDLDITIPTPANFAQPIAYANDANGLAKIVRTGGSYELHIFDDGAIECWLNASLCGKMGFTVGP